MRSGTRNAIRNQEPGTRSGTRPNQRAAAHLQGRATQGAVRQRRPMSEGQRRQMHLLRGGEEEVLYAVECLEQSLCCGVGEQVRLVRNQHFCMKPSLI